MIAAWMVYAVLVALLLTLAGVAAERTLLLLRRPVRGVWAAVLVLSLLIPLLGLRMPGQFSLPKPLRDAARAVMPAPAIVIRQREPAPMSRTIAVQPLPLLWVTASLGLFAFLLHAFGKLQGRRSEWRRQTVDGTPVLVARELGPAVVGWRRLDIVVPEWVLALGERARRLILAHELEHVRRGDPRLSIAAWLPLVLMPWNPALWWQLRRLRRAIELDCDARVIQAGVEPGEYGKVLLDVGGLCAARGLPALAAFAERSTDLEVRIRTFTRPLHARPLPTLVSLGGALLLFVSACLMPDPLEPSFAEVAWRLKEAAASGSIMDRLRNHPPSDLVAFVQDSSGQILSQEAIDTSAHRGQIYTNRTMREILTVDIASVEVIKSRKLTGLGHIGGVIVITLKPEGVERYRRLWSQSRQ